MKTEEIPKEVMESITKISNSRGVNVDELVSEYNEILNSPLVRGQQGSEESKQIWAGKILHRNRMCKSPVTTYKTVIPFGMSEPRFKKDAEKTIENMYAFMYVAINNGNENEYTINEIYLGGKDTEIARKLEIMQGYSDVELCDQGRSVGIGENTKFGSSRRLNISDEDFLTRICKFRKIDRISDTILNRSKVNDGYLVKTDMYLVEGMVNRVFNKGYAITDDSLEYDEKPVKVGTETFIIPQTLTVWTPKRFIKWGENSELMFLGTIEISDKKPFMNAYYVFPSGFAIELPKGNGKK